MNLLKKTLAIISLACVATAVFAEDDAAVDRGPVYHIFSNIDLVPTTKLEYDRPRIVIKAIVPRLVSEDENEAVIADYNAIIAEIIDEEGNAFREEVKSHSDYQDTLASSDIKNDVIIDFDSSLLNSGKQNAIISLRFAIHGVISGMPRSYRKHRVLNYNFDTGNVIELSDLFVSGSNYLEVIANSARNKLSKILTDKSRMAYGSSATAENYSNWNITPRGLRITFDREQVAPSIYGSQTITIPYAELAEIIDPDSLLATCLKRKHSCFTKPVDTGGFIDEAHSTQMMPVTLPNQEKYASFSFKDGKYNI